MIKLLKNTVHSTVSRFCLFGIIFVIVTISALALKPSNDHNLNRILQYAEAEGLSYASEIAFRKDNSIMIAVKRIEWDAQPDNGLIVNCYYEVNNKTGNKLLLVDFIGAMECSADGNQWYPFSWTHTEWLGIDKSMLLSMGWNTGDSDDLYAHNYISPGINTLKASYYLNEYIRPECEELGKMPNGYYRIVLRVCEYVDPREIFDGSAKLVTFGYFCGNFQIENGRVCAS